MRISRFIAAAALLAFGILLSPAQAQRYDDTVECKSRGYEYTECDTPFRRVELVRQTSDSDCIEGRTWGFKRGRIWVDQGCGGVFAERGGRPGGGSWGGGSSDQVTCRSENYGYSRCDVRWRNAYLVRQLSGSDCVEGRSWGLDRRGLWVDDG